VHEAKAAFIKNQPTAEILQPENGQHKSGEFILIPGVKEDDFAVTNEAFCQIISELPLNTDNDAGDFLTKATAFCNEKLLGSLGCMIVVDQTSGLMPI